MNQIIYLILKEIEISDKMLQFTIDKIVNIEIIYKIINYNLKSNVFLHRYYMIHNWFTFVLLTLLPAIFLMVGNTAILIAFCKWTKHSKKCQSNYANAGGKHSQNRYKVNHSRLYFVII